MPKRVHWVNLPPSGDFKDATGASIPTTARRLAQFAVEFENDTRPGRYSYELRRLTEDLYSPEERKRNPKFSAHFFKGSGIVMKALKKKHGRWIDLSAGGGVEYRLRAVTEHLDDEGEIVTKEVASSDTVITKRLLYLRQVAMQGTEGVANRVMAAVKQHFTDNKDAYFVEWVEDQPLATVAARRALVAGSAEEIAFLNDVQAHDFPAHMGPYGVIVVWTNYLCDLVEAEKGAPLTEGEAKSARRHRTWLKRAAHRLDLKDVPAQAWTFDRSTRVLNIDAQSTLWFGITKADTAEAEDWFMSGSWEIACTDGTPLQGTLTKADVALDDVKTGKDGGYFRLKVNLSNALGGKIPKDISFKLWLRTAELVAGDTLSFDDGTTVILVSTKGSWDDADEDELKVALLHELGHFLGMVSDGEGEHPDKAGFYYEDLGHDGPHCSNGAVYEFDKKRWSSGAGCVMFGDVHKETPLAFCDECKPVVRKLDLGPPTPSGAKAAPIAGASNTNAAPKGGGKH